MSLTRGIDGPSLWPFSREKDMQSLLYGLHRLFYGLFDNMADGWEHVCYK